MGAEAKQEAWGYANAHPDLDTPHLMLGEMSLQSFLDGLQSRDAHVAYKRLQRAAALNREAVKPRLLLAELYWCVGADHALRAIGRRDREVRAVRPQPRGRGRAAAIDRGARWGRHHGRPVRARRDRRRAGPRAGHLAAAPRSNTARVDEERAERALESIIRQGAASELVLLQRNGTLIAHANPGADDEMEEEGGLVDVARIVARTVSRYARDLDLGAFKRCTIESPSSLVAVGELGGVLAGARWRRGTEPQRLWERIAVDLEGALGRTSPMKAILAELNETITARGSIVVMRDGMLVASDVREGVDVDRLAALGAAIVTEVGADPGNERRATSFTQIEIAAEHGKVILVEAGPTYLLVLLGARLEIGPGSIEIRSAANRVAREADLARRRTRYGSTTRWCRSTSLRRRSSARSSTTDRGCPGRRPIWSSFTARSPDDRRGELTSIATTGERTLYFDYMPLDLGQIAGIRTKFQLYTVPGQIYYKSTRRLVLQGVDGIVFVADSSAAKLRENKESLADLEENLKEIGKTMKDVPIVIQYNKRDLPDAMTVERARARAQPARVPARSRRSPRAARASSRPSRHLAGMVLETVNKGGLAKTRSQRRRAAPR